MFPDSNIAARFSCRRTKTTAIARTLGQEAKADLVDKLRTEPFSISTDGSSDRGCEEQLYPIIVRYYDADIGRVVSCLLEIATTKERSTGKNIFLLMDGVLKENNIPWKNVIAYSADNAAVMMGRLSGVALFVKKENEDIFILGCPCHLLHLSAEKGVNVLPFSPVDILTPIFYYLEKSSKRHKAFKEVQQMCGAENHAILKHVCTRWLSMERALGRLIEQWVPIKEYFRLEAESEGASPPRKQKAKVTTHDSADRAGQSSQEQELLGGKRKKDNEDRNPKKQKVSQEKADGQSKSAPSAGQSSIKKRPSSVLQSKCKVVHKQSQIFSGSKKSPAVAPGIQKVPSRGESAFASSVWKEKSKVSKLTPTRKTTQGPLNASSGGNTSKSETKKSNASTSVSVPPAGKAAAIHAQLTDCNKLYCMFLLYSTPLFNKLNLELQEEAPQINLLRQKFQDFLRDVLIRFVKPAAVVGASSLQECAYKDKSNQKDDKDLVVGQNVKELLANSKFSDNQRKEFYESVRKYFVAVTDYVIAKFPLEDEVICHAQVTNPGKRLDVSFSSLSFFCHKFHMEDKLDIVELEFLPYQVDPLLNVSLDKRADEVWTEIRTLKDHVTDKLKYDNLGKLMHAILALPHSNADDERLFSIVRKNSTEFRPSLKTTTLSDILTKKLRNQAMKVPCYDMKFPDKLLEKCKKAATSFVSGSSA
eukprot:XP_011674672.1 PREDICTED: uncharacterized protein LOC105443327 [Strongylocentrotus purpuratus]